MGWRYTLCVSHSVFIGPTNGLYSYMMSVIYLYDALGEEKNP